MKALGYLESRDCNALYGSLVWRTAPTRKHPRNAYAQGARVTGREMPVQAPQWTEFLSCPVCCRGFDGAERRPTSLGCGHTLCGRCLSQLQRRLCPFDQAPIGQALPENGALLQLVVVAPPPPSPSSTPPPPAPLGLDPPQLAAFQLASRCVQEMALLLRPAAQGPLFCQNLDALCPCKSFSARLSPPIAVGC